MRQPNPIKVAIIGVFFAVVTGAMFAIATFFNTSEANNCPYTLLVGAGGIKDAICVDFNSFKQKPYENSIHTSGGRVSDFTTSYYGTGIFPQLRVQAQVCQAGVQ